MNLRLLLHGVSLSAWTLALHLAWEYAQCSLFFLHQGLPPTHRAMLWATLGDLALTWSIHSLVALAHRRWFWQLERWKLMDWLAMEIGGILLAITIEWRALSRGSWAYTALAPLLPGTRISFIPVLQLMFLLPLTFWLTRWSLRKLNVSSVRAR